MEGKTKYRIGVGMSVVLVTVATVFDLFTLIPFVGDIAAPLFWGLVGVYFYFKKIPYFDGKKFASIAVSFVAEMIPAVQELPALLAGILAVLFIMRVEDKTGMSLMSPISKGITPPRLQKNPLNGEPGIRSPNKDRGRIPTNVIRPNFKKSENTKYDNTTEQWEDERLDIAA